MERITIEASTPYEVIIKQGALLNVAPYVEEVKKPCSVVIVSDDKVAPLYLQPVKEALTNVGYTVHEYIFPNGEAQKNSHQLIDLVEFLAGKSLTRRDLLIALGGGVVGDMAGFAAATYLRGIDYIQMPTSLLAAVDSSVGGKTAVNLSAGKNLWGAFKQPILVLCDPQALTTLPDEEFNNGCGEVIKYGMLGYPELLDMLEKAPLTASSQAYVSRIISFCVKAKAAVVSQDELEKGLRQLLNFGHTFGHGIEMASHFTIHHGHAVAIGMAIMMRSAVKEGFIQPTECERFLNILKTHHLPTTTDITADILCEAALHDKKSHGQTITIVRPDRWGHCELVTVPHSELPQYLEV
ncbi:MAG: 3-dehydroquinate synthase [Veillonella sp.]|uniref:3-dehydroquinate synthase n=1 Tax=Veillonella sp. TaxID=1926307 RepID=UPI0025DB2D27|nr:3-dehydroquinate synthase [Veillonella sp.]MBS4913236.1 3-dehydroquinate synthase [Veillonella sp.]